MKKLIFSLLVLLVIGFLAGPALLRAVGIYTTRVMVYNGNSTAATFELNGAERTLAPGEAQVYRSSVFSNHLTCQTEKADGLDLRFGRGQHVVNLGPRSLQVREVYYPFDEEKQAFTPYEITPKDRLLLDTRFASDVRTLATCWDCCILLPPGDRPYRFLKPEYKDKRIFVSNR
ncbi:MAG: hypothetical protein AAGJ82_03230 [Bacteroidota bacterium]